MRLWYLLNRIFQQKRWAEELQFGIHRVGLRKLQETTAQVVFQNYTAMIEDASALRSGCTREDWGQRLAHMDGCMGILQGLLPFSTIQQQGLIADAERTLLYARSIPPAAPAKRKSTELTYYSVLIPTMNGEFYYLSTQDYQPEDIVCIPFGAENSMIYGIVKEIFTQDYWKMPLPLWKMKYIDSKAPGAIAEEYRRLIQLQ